MVLNSKSYIDYITDKIGGLRHITETKLTLNLTDLNVISEDFYCHLFNLAYGYNLKNSNFSNSNEKAIDLADDVNKIAIQITSTKTAKKTRETVQKFIEDEKYLQYPKLIIFNILKKSKHNKDFYGDSNFSLNTKSDIWDYSDLLKKISSLDVTKQKIIYVYFLSQFEPISIATRRAPIAYRHHIENFRKNYASNESNSVLYGGREKESQILTDWLNSENRTSKLLLYSAAGRGKSSLIVNWVNTIPQECNIVFMPISIRFETNKPITFFESLASQLAAVAGVSLQSPEYGAVDYFREKSIELLDKIQSTPRKTLIVIDGLDEATGWELGQTIFSQLSGSHIKVLVSAREIANKAANDWANQLGWKIGFFDQLEVPKLEDSSIKKIMLSTDNKVFSGQLLDDLSNELHRLTSGEPLLLNLYITDLLV